MGFAISWVGFKDLGRAEVLKRLGFRDSGTEDEANEAAFSVAEIPTGWTILFANNFHYGAPEQLIAISSGALVVSCQVEEHFMVSGAYCRENGLESWSVRYDGQRGRHGLSTSGTMPPAFAPIQTRRDAKPDDDDHAAGDIGYLFDVPVQLAAAMTGYRHDRWKFDWGQPRFTVVNRLD